MTSAKTKKKSNSQPKYEVDIYWDADDEIYVARVPELKGCSSHGKTMAEAAANAEEAIESFLESLKKRGISPPIPLAEKSYSGEFLVRIDPYLHRDATLRAQQEKMSLNGFVEKVLRKSV
jgi:predicted RNase H-like HicB family nuclease